MTNKELQERVTRLENEITSINNLVRLTQGDLSDLKAKDGHLNLNDIRWLNYGGREFFSPAIREDGCYYIGDATRDGSVKMCNVAGEIVLYNKIAGAWVEQTMGGTDLSYVSLSKSTDQVVGDVTSDVTWDTEDSDTDNFHTGSNAFVTVPTGKAGKYLVIGNLYIDYAGDPGDSLQISLVHNSTSVDVYYNNDIYIEGTSARFTFNFSKIYDLAVSDTMRIEVDFGGDSTTAVKEYNSFFQLHQLS